MNAPSDTTTTVSDLKAAVEAFYTARQWRRFFSPKSLAMSIGIEAAELMEVFQWSDTDEAQAQAAQGSHRERMAEELADVLIYCLTLATVQQLDVSTIIRRKIEANARKYPIVPDPSDESAHAGHA